MTRLEHIKQSDAREAAEQLLTLFCEGKEDCPHRCDECTNQIKDYLKEEIDGPYK